MALFSLHSMRCFSLTLCVLLLGSHALDAQSPSNDSLDYFPYRVGDTWRVRNADTQKEDHTFRVLHDSVDGSSNLYLLIDDEQFMIDTAGDVLSTSGSMYTKVLYRLRARVGDRWKISPANVYSIDYATCAAIYPMNVHGQIRMVKEFHYWLDGSADGGPDSVWYSTRWIARGFGEVQQFYEPDAMFYVSGASINGQTYGDMVAGVERSTAGPSPLRVVPNPFSAGATLSYRLDSRQHVRLTLSDALGRVVATPVDELQDAGEQTVSVDGSNLQEGTYFYQLRTLRYTTSGSLIRQP